MATKLAIELFAGTSPFKTAIEQKDYKCLTLDFNAKFNCDYQSDILELDIATLPKNVSVIWASIDCTYFSRAAKQSNWKKQTLKYRKYHYEPATEQAAKSIAIVEKTIAIIRKYPECVFFIENPVGRLPHIKAIKGLPHHRYQVNYKDWGFDYSKETYIFTNTLQPLPIIRQIRSGKGLRSVNNRVARSVVPSKLIEFLIREL